MTVTRTAIKNRFNFPLNKYCLVFFAFIFLVTGVQARHIIGGEITYTCRGNGTYDFEMRIYRDCASGGAVFDNPASVTIYREVNGQYTQFLDLAV